MRNHNEPVRLTRIYTRAGDSGVTSLGDGRRVRKSDPRIEAYGSVDELNATLALVLAAAPPREVLVSLQHIQNDLFDRSADLAVPSEDRKRERLRVQAVQVERLEQLCDQVNEGLEPLKSFVLPRGDEVPARLHFARTVCRRAERRVVGTPYRQLARSVVQHAELSLGGGTLTLGQGDPSSHSVYVAVEEADAHYDRAKAAGAEIVRDARCTPASRRACLELELRHRLAGRRHVTGSKAR
jgi:cob(I)alamin adenosyltransferase